ncbi:MAG: hypothetical protein ACI8RD_002442 [Bacillariaceae sp.]|jgi:hypothetical protein
MVIFSLSGDFITLQVILMNIPFASKYNNTTVLELCKKNKNIDDIPINN